MVLNKCSFLYLSKGNVWQNVNIVVMEFKYSRFWFVLFFCLHRWGHIVSPEHWGILGYGRSTEKALHTSCVALSQWIPARIFSWTLGLCGISKVLNTATRSRAMLATSPALALGTLDTTMSENIWNNGTLEWTKADFFKASANRGLPSQIFNWTFPCSLESSCRTKSQKTLQKWGFESKSH